MMTLLLTLFSLVAVAGLLNLLATLRQYWQKRHIANERVQELDQTREILSDCTQFRISSTCGIFSKEQT